MLGVSKARLIVRTSIASVCLAALLVLGLPASVGAAAGDVGHRGPSTEGIDNSAPTGAKPESRLWWNDGSWWGVLFDTPNNEYRIWRLDAQSQAWVNTGVAVDGRNQSRGDTLWDGTHLYVASHIFVNSSGAAGPGQEARLYRFSYEAATDTYSLDDGFPVQISDSKSEALVLERDSTGKLWATWARGSQVWVNRTLGDDRSWGQPFVLPFPEASDLYFDDLASIISFGGNRIGVMWSDQIDDAFYFAEHEDGAPDADWTIRTALQGPDLADDHVNLKTDSAGRVYAAVKTSQTTTGSPYILLLVRDPGSGDWANHVVGVRGDRHTRPIVMIDESAGVVMVFATSQESGGSIYKKTSPLNAISFPPGKGAVFIQDGANPDMNDATSTKQSVSQTTGVVVLASNDTTQEYWHNYDSLVLDSDFTASRRTGAAPFTVDLTDTSPGNPSDWSWDFGDGSPPSTVQNPRHTYTAPGSYTVTLTASTPNGATNTETKPDYVTVTPSITYTGTDDSWIRSTTPDSNFGTQTILNVKNGNETAAFLRTYVRFAVSGMTLPVVEAKLRFYVTDGGSDGGTAYLVDNSWTERQITWTNAPPITGSPLGSAGPAVAGDWIEIPLPAEVFAAGDGVYAFALTSGSLDTVTYRSRQAIDQTQQPQLVLGVPAAPVADFSATPTSGSTPLTVAFTDATSGATSWNWDFGDGRTSAERNPSHVYTAPGTYTVALTARGPGGTDVETKMGYVSVASPPPVAEFSAATRSGVAPLAVSFTDLSTGALTSWSWNFGDGGTSTEQNPSHTFTAPGTYTVALTTVGPGGTDEETKIGYVTATLPPDFTIAASPTSRTMRRNDNKNFTVTVTPNATFRGPVALTVAGLPAGTSGTFKPTTLNVGAVAISSTLKITTSSSTPLGTRTLTITGTSGSLVRTTSIVVTVR